MDNAIPKIARVRLGHISSCLTTANLQTRKCSAECVVLRMYDMQTSRCPVKAASRADLGTPDWWSCQNKQIAFAPVYAQMSQKLCQVSRILQNSAIWLRRGGAKTWPVWRDDSQIVAYSAVVQHQPYQTIALQAGAQHVLISSVCSASAAA